MRSSGSWLTTVSWTSGRREAPLRKRRVASMKKGAAKITCCAILRGHLAGGALIIPIEARRLQPQAGLYRVLPDSVRCWQGRRVSGANPCLRRIILKSGRDREPWRFPENSPEPRIRVTQYSADDVEVLDIEDVATLPALVKADHVTWVDIQGFGNEAKLRGVAEAFGLHMIALENAVNVPQRAKAESYADHNLIIARAPLLNDDGDLAVPQVCFIVGKGFIITFQERYLGFFDEVRERIRRGGGQLRKHGVDYLAYALDRRHGRPLLPGRAAALGCDRRS